MSPRRRSPTSPLDLESAFLLQLVSSPSADPFDVYVRSLAPPRKKRARRRKRPAAPYPGVYADQSTVLERTAPAEVFPPDPNLWISVRPIHAPDDLRAFVEALQVGEFHDDPFHRYVCPWHELGEPTVTLDPQAGSSTLVHCHQCGYRFTPTEMLVEMFGIDKAAVFAANTWTEPLLAKEFIDVEVNPLD